MEQKGETRFVKRVELVILLITIVVSSVLYTEAMKKEVLVNSINIVNNTKSIDRLRITDEYTLELLHKIDKDNTEIKAMLQEHLRVCKEIYGE